MLLRMACNLHHIAYYWNFPFNISDGSWLRIIETGESKTLDKESLLHKLNFYEDLIFFKILEL
jgi:hypothetical protein